MFTGGKKLWWPWRFGEYRFFTNCSQLLHGVWWNRRLMAQNAIHRQAPFWLPIVDIPQSQDWIPVNMLHNSHPTGGHWLGKVVLERLTCCCSHCLTASLLIHFFGGDKHRPALVPEPTLTFHMALVHSIIHLQWRNATPKPVWFTLNSDSTHATRIPWLLAT